MIIFPAIDIRGGRCVRLVQGRADQETVYGDDPAAMGQRWQDAGAAWLHVVDLDGAFGATPKNLEVIRRLRRAVAIPIQLGGGIRSLDTMATYLDAGIDRLILGTAILKDPALAAQALTTYPGRIALGLDARDGLLAVEGWTETTSRTAAEVARELAPLNPAAIIYTDISRDGVKRGVNLHGHRQPGPGHHHPRHRLGRDKLPPGCQGPPPPGTPGRHRRHHREGPVRRQPRP